jgi:Uma2 family endonuclease
MSTLVERLTADEYLARDDPRRTELIDGVVVVNEPGNLHQIVCTLFLVELVMWTRSLEGHGTATFPLNVKLDAKNVLAPDVLWFSDDVPLVLSRAHRPPDLVVEVRSKSTWRHDLGRKKELYRQHGVKEIWLVDTASRTVIVFRREETYEVGPRELLRSPLLPGFAASVAELIPKAPSPA